MSFNISNAVEQGFSRTFERNGLILVGAFVVFGLLGALASETTGGSYVQFLADRPEITLGGEGPGSSPLAPFLGATREGLDSVAPSLPFEIAAALSIVFALVEEALRIVAIRVFASGKTETIPSGLARRNLAWATINAAVAGVLITIATLVGLVFFVVPGVFLAMSFYFVRQVIAVEDRTLFDAMGRAWDLSAGNRLDLFVLGVVVFLVGLVASVPPALVGLAAPLVGAVLSVTVSGFVAVFGVAATTRAFEQVRAADARDAEPTA